MTYIPDTRKDGTYNQKYLNAKDKEYLRGFDHALEDTLESFFYNLESYDFEVEGEDIELGRFLDNHEEIKQRLLDNIKQHFEADRNEMIVSMIDHMDDGEYEKIKEKVNREAYELGEESEQEE